MILSILNQSFLLNTEVELSLESCFGIEWVNLSSITSGLGGHITAASKDLRTIFSSKAWVQASRTNEEVPFLD